MLLLGQIYSKYRFFFLFYSIPFLYLASSNNNRYIMKKVIVLFIVSMVISSSFGQKARSVKSPLDSVAYAIGVSMYQGVKQLDLDLDLDVIADGMEAAYKEKAIFTAEEANAYIQEYLSGLEARRVEENKEAGIKFLEENKAAEGVVVTESGLQYEIIVEGEGPKPVAKDQVKVHYTGTLLDGTVFDSSVERGEPAVFGVTQVIKGWGEVLQLMPVGSKYKVFIPSDLAYGDRGSGREIKPGSTLVFEIELIEIVSK